jgi:hypothetical protein
MWYVDRFAGLIFPREEWRNVDAGDKRKKSFARLFGLPAHRHPCPNIDMC